MPKIGPARTAAELDESAQATYLGQGKPPLPGVKTDAWQVDADAYNANADLAELIKAAVGKLKPSDKRIPRFLLGWRLYPNAASPYWKGKLVHSCGCCCACSSGGKPRKKKRGS
jgi:hypothetical protein